MSSPCLARSLQPSPSVRSLRMPSGSSRRRSLRTFRRWRWRRSPRSSSTSRGCTTWRSYVSRPLHLRALLKASAASFAITALFVYALRWAPFFQHRLVLFMTFIGFISLAAFLRLGILDALFVAWADRSRPVSVVLGSYPRASVIADRLTQLRGFNRVEPVTPAMLDLGAAEALRITLLGLPASGEARVAVFIDATDLPPREVFDASVLAQSFGAELYVISPLLGSLESNRLLARLLGAPAVRIRRASRTRSRTRSSARSTSSGSAVLLVVQPPGHRGAGRVHQGSRRRVPSSTGRRASGGSGLPFEFLQAALDGRERRRRPSTRSTSRRS